MMMARSEKLVGHARCRPRGILREALPAVRLRLKARGIRSSSEKSVRNQLFQRR